MTTLASVVLGALLALAGGIWTERWKQRKEARAAARLVWLELMIDYSTLQGPLLLRNGQPSSPFRRTPGWPNVTG